MRRYIFILILVPFIEATAATPFVSIGVSPTITNVRYDYGANRVHPYYNTFTSNAGVANIGVKYGVHEWYARYTWFTSGETMETSDQTSYFQDYSITNYHGESRDSWQDMRFAIGHRVLVRHAKPDKLDAFLGFALSIGSGVWRLDQVDVTETYYYWEDEFFRESRSSTVAKYSKYSYGGIFELGACYPIYSIFKIEVSGQLGANLTAFEDEESPGHFLRNEAKIFEPALTMSLRLEIPIVNIEARPKHKFDQINTPADLGREP